MGLRQTRFLTQQKKNVSIIIRYVTDFEIRERLVGLVRVEDMSGKGLCSILTQKLECLGLKLTNIVGQCYDGASNMSGQYSGVQALVKHAAGDKAVCTHCFNHMLALVLEQSASSHPVVIDVFSWLNNTYEFLKHYKVLVEYEKVIREKKVDRSLQISVLIRDTLVCTINEFENRC